MRTSSDLGAEFLASIVFSGALERYPGMKFVLGECGASWIPYVLGRMDEEYEDQFRSRCRVPGQHRLLGCPGALPWHEVRAGRVRRELDPLRPGAHGRRV